MFEGFLNNATTVEALTGGILKRGKPSPHSLACYTEKKFWKLIVIFVQNGAL